MSKEARNQDVALSAAVRVKFEELIGLLSEGGFGPQGPPLETTFAEIEKYGHQVGRMVARAVNERLADQHGEHFQKPVCCPTCETECLIQEKPVNRSLQTQDGEVPLHEPACHCPVCDRDFFPSASLFEARR